MQDQFQELDVQAGGVAFAGLAGGSGPAVLLLHGFPQTHLAWRFVAPALMDKYTLIIPDRPGYGSSRIFDTSSRWAKRRVAKALAQLMDCLGHETFAVVGHDRGARSGYRLARDAPQRVHAYASLAVISSLDAWEQLDMAFAIKSFHWLMLAQPDDVPERLLASDPQSFLDAVLLKMVGSLDRFEPEILAAYRNAFRDPAVRHAICEDYRAATLEDLELDRQDRAAGRKLRCKVCVIWPTADTQQGSLPTGIWKQWADEVMCWPVDGGHLLPEFSHTEVSAHLDWFLARIA